MGTLVRNDTKRFRKYFEEMAKLLGIEVYYQYPLEDKHYTDHGEIEGHWSELIPTDVIFEEYPKQHTLRKLGWYSEDQETQPIIQVSWNLPNLQVGAQFVVPSGIDKAKGRLFRVAKMTNIMQYPECCTCSLVPEYEDTNQPVQQSYVSSNYNYLKDEGD